MSTDFSTWIKTSITIKLISIGIITLVLLIPTSMIKSLISERESIRESAVNEISGKWGREQVISGPILSIPYKRIEKNVKGEIITTTEFAHFLPNTLAIQGKIFPEKRYRGLYETVVYNTKLNCTGTFLHPNFAELEIDEKNILWKNTVISIGISDMRGIKDNININWDNTTTLTVNPGIANKEVINPGVSVRIPLDKPELIKEHYSFSFDLNLNGSKTLQFIPVGKETNLQLTSSWPNPSFIGAFLPDKRDITDTGFTASWKVLQLNRDYPQQWLGAAYSITQSMFGVNLLIPVDEYQKSMRSAKYAVMIIGLTFLIFFFVELFNKKRVHPIQYILVGLALCLFYTMLLSLSEYINFNYAYTIASIAVIALITAYFRTIFKNKFLTGVMGLILLAIYSFIFILIQLQDYALLFGSIGLFVVLAIVMYLSRNINWYGVKIESE